MTYCNQSNKIKLYYDLPNYKHVTSEVKSNQNGGLNQLFKIFICCLLYNSCLSHLVCIYIYTSFFIVYNCKCIQCWLIILSFQHISRIYTYLQIWGGSNSNETEFIKKKFTMVFMWSFPQLFPSSILLFPLLLSWFKHEIQPTTWKALVSVPPWLLCP